MAECSRLKLDGQHTCSKYQALYNHFIISFASGYLRVEDFNLHVAAVLQVSFKQWRKRNISALDSHVFFFLERFTLYTDLVLWSNWPIQTSDLVLWSNWAISNPSFWNLSLFPQINRFILIWC